MLRATPPPIERLQPFRPDLGVSRVGLVPTFTSSKNNCEAIKPVARRAREEDICEPLQSLEEFIIPQRQQTLPGPSGLLSVRRVCTASLHLKRVETDLDQAR